MVFVQPLVVEAVHLHESENAAEHHTSAYELVYLEPPTPVLRRGQPFRLSMSFDRPYDSSTDIVRLLFNFGANPEVLRGTMGVNTVTNGNNFLPDLEAWGVQMLSSKAKGLSVQVWAPVDSPVGVWQLTIETTTLDNKKRLNTHKVDKDIYLLFNPWLKDDDVYMEDQRLLDEYVSNDTGKIWFGDEKSCRGREWVFGQFDACVLPACQLMLERSGIKEALRGDPIRMTRFISKIVNWNDDGGVLVGRWDDEYSDGTAPSAWTGSVPILEKYLKTKDTVRYGQCWVFAGVVTTVCRALGIPSRVVTNIISAHDKNATLSIDNFYTSETGGFERRGDSIWNFHVWNDVWMARPDLPKGYGGWQAIDATPQEESDGLYQCGPTSLEAIRGGAVGYNYDVPFMLATVNADVIYWVEDKESELHWRRVACDQRDIGRMILTKAPFIFDPNGDRDREDITRSYKDKEGTPGDRLALHRAARSNTYARRLYEIPDSTKEDVEFKLVDLDRVKIGEPFALTVYIENKSTQPRKISAILSVKSVYYNGVNAKLVKKETSDFIVQPGEREEVRLTVSADEYMDKLVEYSMMKLCTVATVDETRQIWADEDDFQVLKPTIDVKANDKMIVGQQATVVLTFTNPLAETLTGCELNYAGPGLKKNITLPIGNIEPNAQLHGKLKIVPQKAGQQHIVTTFTSDQLVDVTGSATVQVFEEEDSNL